MSDTGTDKNEVQLSLSQRIWEVITSSTFVGLLIFLGSLFGIGVLLWAVVTKLGAGMGLPLLALSSVLLLLGALLVFTTLIHLIGLSDPKSALGLPDGSVRALLALALVGLFAIMASSVLVGSPPREVTGVLADDIDSVLKANPNERDIFWRPEKRLDEKQPRTFTAVFGSTAHIDDFGKQMLTLVGTLMTAVISFYFGASTTSSAAGTGTAGSSPGTGATGPSAESGTTDTSTGTGAAASSTGTGTTETGTGAKESSPGSGTAGSSTGSGTVGSSAESGITNSPKGS
jgi:hypothetical protein